jgi:antitoxin MazE
MIKSLVKHGNSYALVIDRPILDLLKLRPDSPVELTTDGRSLTIRPAPSHEERVRAALDETHRDFGHALKRLAE